MTTARNAGRINVWPSTVIARAADAAESKVLGRMTIWPTHTAALQNREHEEGGGTYLASAVHFDGSAWLGIAALAATDNALLSIVFWARIAILGDVSGETIYVSDPDNYVAVCAGVSGEGGNVSISQTCASADGSKTLATIPSGNAFPLATWNCYIATLDAATGAGIVYNKDTNTMVAPNATGGAFINAFDGLPFYVGGDGSGGSIADFADIRIMPGTDLRTAGNISETTRRLFVDADGKPVDPAVATLALGTPCILFSGNASPGGFDLNQGTGGAFTLTGSLTNAITSPSD